MRSARTILMFAAALSMGFTPSLMASLVAESENILVPSPAESLTRANAGKETDKNSLPLLFEANRGQTDEEVKFISRSAGYMVYLTERAAEFALKTPQRKATDKMPQHSSEVIRMEFSEANEHPTIEGSDEAITRTNYYKGNQRIENIVNYERTVYRELYKGIDAVFYGTQRQVEYDFNILPNADPGQIKLNFEGSERVSIDPAGALVIKTENAELVQQKPVAYQIINGERREVICQWSLENKRAANEGVKVSFELGDYDRSRSLVIDPVLLYSTYLGGTGFDTVNDIAADPDGNAYLVGDTSSLNFHGKTRSSGDGFGVFVSKIDPTGTQLIYTTILEGNNDDSGKTIAVDASGNVYVGGEATNGFPTTPGAFSTVKNPTSFDAFIAKLNPGGTSVYVTYYGGSKEDSVFDLSVDSTGKVYAVGSTWSGLTFPKKNEFQGCGAGNALNSSDGFLAVLNAAGSDIQYSSCFGGTVLEDANAVSLDSLNNAYITGFTSSKNNFPVKNAAQPTSGNGVGSIQVDAFLIKFNPTLSGEASVLFSTYLGGGGTDEGYGIDLSPSGSVFVAGVTGSTDFPLLNPFDSTNQISECFVTQYSSGGTLTNSTFLGGSDQDQCNDIVAGKNSVTVTGETLSNDFPVSSAFQGTRRGLRDAFVTKLQFGSGILSSSYFGGAGHDRGLGIALNGSSIFIAGKTESNNLTTTAFAPNVPLKATSNASAASPDGFVAKILDTRLDSVGVFRPTSTFLLTQSTTNVVTQNAGLTGNLAGQRGVSGDWDGDGTDTIGSFTNGTWKVRNANFPFINFPPITYVFGVTGDRPVVGDWDGDGIDTAGVFRPGTGEFFLTNETNASAINLQIRFGIAEDLPVAGDWNGDGIDTIGVFRPSTGQFFLTNSNDANPPIDLVTFFGTTGDLPLSGDFNGDGTDTIGVRRTSTGEFFLSNDNVTIARQFVFGAPNTDQPIVGDWDGIPAP